MATFFLCKAKKRTTGMQNLRKPLHQELWNSKKKLNFENISEDSPLEEKRSL